MLPFETFLSEFNNASGYRLFGGNKVAQEVDCDAKQSQCGTSSELTMGESDRPAECANETLHQGWGGTYLLSQAA